MAIVDCDCKWMSEVPVSEDNASNDAGTGEYLEACTCDHFLHVLFSNIVTHRVLKNKSVTLLTLLLHILKSLTSLI